MCVPRFDSKPVFSRLVDEAGGYFSLAPEGILETSRAYLADSAVLETRWRTDAGEMALRDGMVVQATGSLLPQTLLVRRVECRVGKAKLRVNYSPVHGFEHRPPQVRRHARAIVCSWDALAISLCWDADLEITPGEEATYEISRGDSLTFVFSVADRSPLIFVRPDRALELLEETDAWWKEWCAGLDLPTERRTPMARSFITMRMLTYSPTAAPVAAPTTSLPERIGDSANWDYRYSWPRDASIGLAAFLAVDRIEESHAFMHWLLHAARQSRPRIDVLYDLFGRTAARERIVDVTGYRGSRPVRVGNAAAKQHQLDVYGWVVDTAYLLAKAQGYLHGETWRMVAAAADLVAGKWREPDSGVWERRGERRHYVHSKLMGWLALDRVVKIADILKRDDRRIPGWTKERDAIAGEVRERGYSDELGSYVDAYGGDELDAALLLLPVLDFEPPGSERVAATVRAIRTNLSVGGPLVYRYSERVGKEGVFLPCSFWLVQALARMGEREEAEGLFQQLMERANDVGLFAEELDPETGDHLGNFPQVFTHATLLQACVALGEGDQPTRRNVPNIAP